MQFNISGSGSLPFVLHSLEQSIYQTLPSGVGTVSLNGVPQAITLAGGAVYTLAVLKGAVLQFSPDRYDVEHNDQASNVRVSAQMLRD